MPITRSKTQAPTVTRIHHTRATRNEIAAAKALVEMRSTKTSPRPRRACAVYTPGMYQEVEEC
jgi:hypothetical protein